MIARVRRRYQVSGVVQGVGFRPFVYQQATRLGLSGSVSNDVRGVVIEVEGSRAAVDELGQRLSCDPPPLAVVESVITADLPLLGGAGFTIAASDASSGGVRTLVGPDIATCGDCLRELRDRTDRRFGHPFISCTNCGPRFSIITDVPYDRPLTTMAGFGMCAACTAEYRDPGDRRFHAQTIACHDCGPGLALSAPGAPGTTGSDALDAARRLLAGGAIVAVKGIGGYHLACDARNETAVATLRQRKQRGDKPFAVMVRDLAAARELADIRDEELALLTGPQRPAMLLRRSPGADVLGPSVAPGSPDLGLILPYTPVHHLLLDPLDGGEPLTLVMTSGNLGGEPIVFRDDDAQERLAHLADAWLAHDRPIHVPVDDSVSRVVDGREAPVRRSRGYAPLPITLPIGIAPGLAVGADLKNTCAVGGGRHAWMSQHIGDMDDLATLEAFTVSEHGLEQLAGVVPESVAADAHPGYRSSAWARRHARDVATPVVAVQHHHAHVASVMAEHGLDGGQPVLGFAFDGTGFGTDGAVWGGELLVADYRGFRRAAHLAYVPLPGGDLAVERPYRMALAHLWAAGEAWTDDLAPVAACPAAELRVVRHQLESDFGTAPTSSMGRLFDAVASLAGVRHTVGYEAQAAIELEGLARDVDPDGAYGFELRGSAGGPMVADAGPLICSVVADIRRGVPQQLVAARFHTGVAELIVDLAMRERAATGLDVAVLGGGVFGNVLLLSLARHKLEDRGFDVLTAQKVPSNDGGIALGQLMVAGAQTITEPTTERRR